MLAFKHVQPDRLNVLWPQLLSSSRTKGRNVTHSNFQDGNKPVMVPVKTCPYCRLYAVTRVLPPS